MPYEVETPVFVGPFDLLLHLIMREQVDLYEVPLAIIVDGYLAHLDRLHAEAAAVDLDVATEFLLIAATLVELKARRLLPEPASVDLDEELGLWEERDLLLSRLLECKTFKDAAAALAARAEEAGRSWPRVAGLEERYAHLLPDLLEGVGAEDLRVAFLRATAPRPVPRVDVSHLPATRASVTDAVAELLAELPGGGRLSFRRLTSGLAERLEVVVRFLALLELAKRGLVELHQATTFGDIEAEWVGDQEDADVPVAAAAGARAGAVDAYDG